MFRHPRRYLVAAHLTGRQMTGVSNDGRVLFMTWSNIDICFAYQADMSRNWRGRLHVDSYRCSLSLRSPGVNGSNSHYPLCSSARYLSRTRVQDVPFCSRYIERLIHDSRLLLSVSAQTFTCSNLRLRECIEISMWCRCEQLEGQSQRAFCYAGKPWRTQCCES